MKVLHRVSHPVSEQSRIPGGLSLLAILLLVSLLSGCSTGCGGRSRGSASDVATQAADDQYPGRDTGRTRTRTDHQEASVDRYESEFSYAENSYEDQDDDASQSLLANLLIGLFLSGDDGEPDRNHSTDGDTVKIQHHNLLVWLSQASLAGDTIESVSTVSVMCSGYQGELRLNLEASLFF